MTPYVPYKTAAYLAPANEINHLFAVMNDPCDQHQVLVLNVTSIKEGKYHDPACEINVGDHPFIKHPSYILYRLAETTRSARVGKMVDLKYYIPREDWDGGVFARIAAGIRASDDTPSRIIKYAEQHNII